MIKIPQLAHLAPTIVLVAYHEMAIQIRREDMSQNTFVRSRNTVSLPFHSVRHITCPEDEANNRKVYVGYAPAKAIIALSTNKDVRDYLLDLEGKERRTPTQVHRAIEDTLRNTPENFAVLNSGIVIVTYDCKIDEKEKTLILTNPSIINGAQTQGIIKDNSNIEANPHVKFEIIVTQDDDLIAEISIARNFQNDVMTISIAGRRGQLDDLEQAFQAKNPESKLQKSETQKFSDDYIKTERLLQVITALIPEELWPEDKDFSKVYAYSTKAKCLKDFQALYERVKGKHSSETLESDKNLYQFYLDIAAQAWGLYEKWRTHQGFYGTRLRAIKRDEYGNILEVPDGIIFPILASLAAFAKKGKSGWAIKPPASFIDEELIENATTVYMDIAGSQPNVMGKSRSCYSSLYQITSIYKKLSE
jgi:AIPR protein